MRIGVLTSSRADYSIYLPLLKLIRADSYFDLSIIAFGTHLSKQYGNTVEAIESDGFEVMFCVKSLPENDTPEAIVRSMGDTIFKFSALWADHKFDLVFALGDRYEMFCACSSAVPFNMKLAHIHGGEQTLGAIDDSFRHSITHMSSIHFTAAEQYRSRVIALKGSDEGVYNVGSLAYDNLRTLTLLSIEEIRKRFKIDLGRPTILITFHPETISYEQTEAYIREIINALKSLEDYQMVFTMPNADTSGNCIRTIISEYVAAVENAVAFESLGTIGYLSVMRHCSFMLGNTSSGFVEASYFPKFVINLGLRQSGRLAAPNIYNCMIKREAIIEAVKHYSNWRPSGAGSPYGDGNAAQKIVNILRDRHG